LALTAKIRTGLINGTAVDAGTKGLQALKLFQVINGVNKFGKTI